MSKYHIKGQDIDLLFPTIRWSGSGAVYSGIKTVKLSEKGFADSSTSAEYPRIAVSSEHTFKVTDDTVTTIPFWGSTPNKNNEYLNHGNVLCADMATTPMPYRPTNWPSYLDSNGYSNRLVVENGPQFEPIIITRPAPNRSDYSNPDLNAGHELVISIVYDSTTDTTTITEYKTDNTTNSWTINNHCIIMDLQGAGGNGGLGKHSVFYNNDLPYYFVQTSGDGGAGGCFGIFAVDISKSPTKALYIRSYKDAYPANNDLRANFTQVLYDLNNMDSSTMFKSYAGSGLYEVLPNYPYNVTPSGGGAGMCSEITVNNTDTTWFICLYSCVGARGGSGYGHWGLNSCIGNANPFYSGAGGAGGNVSRPRLYDGVGVYTAIDSM